MPFGWQYILLKIIAFIFPTIMKRAIQQMFSRCDPSNVTSYLVETRNMNTDVSHITRIWIYSTCQFNILLYFYACWRKLQDAWCYRCANYCLLIVLHCTASYKTVIAAVARIGCLNELWIYHFIHHPFLYILNPAG